MLHLRKDYDAIQPWPVKRPHILRHYDVDRGNGAVASVERWSDDDIGEAISVGLAGPIIPDDEPVFLLRASDPVAAATVREWASLALAAGADLQLCERVRAWADRMDEYRQRHAPDKTSPDTPEGMLR